MSQSIRKPIFILALILILLVVLLEIGSTAIIGATTQKHLSIDAPRPGLGIPYLALIDGLVLYTGLLIAAGLFVPGRIQGRVQGVATLFFSAIMLLIAIALIVKAVALLSLMITLLLAVPFGTIAYFIHYADFNVDAATLSLSLLMMLKLFFAGSLIFAHQSFLQNKGLVLIVLTSLLANIIIGFLHGMVPGFLVSITDAIAAIIIAILAGIWALIYFVSAIISILKSIG